MKKPIPGYDNKYFIDEAGLVYTVMRKGTSGGLLSQRQNSSGYMRVDLQKGKIKHSVFVHRLVAEAFLPKIDGKDCINHKDGNKTNNHVSNLEWCTRSENTIHAVSMGFMDNIRRNYGQDHHNSKITDKEAIEIYKLSNTDISGMEIARRYKVSKNVVYKIIHGIRKLSSGISVGEYLNGK